MTRFKEQKSVHPSTLQIKNFGDPKRPLLEGVFEIKKLFLRGRYKTERDSIWDPIGDHLRMIPPGDKT